MAGKLAVTHTSNELSGDLRRLGFTEYEARVYIQLLRQSPATAYEISKSTGVPRPNTYQALEALAQRAAVLPVSETPVRYVAAKPSELFDTIARQTQTLCNDLAERLSVIAPSSDDQYVWTLRGDLAVHDKIRDLISESRKVIWIKAADDVLRRHKAALKAAAERGVETLIVLFGFDADEFRFTDRCRVYIHEGSGVRMGSADNLFTVAVDHTEMLTAAMDGEVTAAHSRNRPIVNLAQSLIRHDYYMAEIFARFGPQIDAEFGPHLKALRMACFSPEQVVSFKQKTGL
ncbi:TrmB family transcriptional regulator [Microvirga pakistanensis]|uniref:TrmB family transcriptional regulator n=1 Tax=Microvirga pakistanensis TaxID=1682650 RepID=UPI00106BF9FB|nr:TrmB family transcriptional regulator [Microvirga pakistanensis]